MQVVTEGELLGMMGKGHLHLHPLQVPLRPGGDALRGSSSMTQQELAQAMPGAKLIAFSRPACAHQIPQRFVCAVRYPHGRQISSTVAARELLGITPVGLHPIARFHGYQSWSN